MSYPGDMPDIAVHSTRPPAGRKTGYPEHVLTGTTMGTITGQFCKTAGILGVLLTLLLAGCASDSSLRTPHSAHPGLSIATTLVGTPYRYGGSSPRGFDCSGLVYYAYGKAGIRVPRTTQAQHRDAASVPLSELHPGDLLFFRRGGLPVGHVGIYAGNDRFLHAPSRGKQVSYASLNDDYWQTRLLSAGRY